MEGHPRSGPTGLLWVPSPPPPPQAGCLMGHPTRPQAWVWSPLPSGLCPPRLSPGCVVGGWFGFGGVMDAMGL